ncbi:MAG: glycosyltransferase family 9 protein [Candidatus Omnitrophota bacterium]|nr:glycosyltransferase family 9 protein [Candidatus Omnitrophota bacterium]
MKYVYKKKILLLFAFLLDIIGNIVFFPFRSLKRRKPGDPRKILLIRCDHIGDVVAATVVLGPARRAFHWAKIDFLVSSAASDILRRNPFLDNVMIFDAPWFKKENAGILVQFRALRQLVSIMRKGGYDLAVDFRGDLRHITAMFLAGIDRRIGYGITGGGFLLTREVPYRGLMRETDRNMELLRSLGVEERTPDADLVFSDEDKDAADALVREAGIDGKYAVLHLVPGHRSKVWDPEKFASVIRHIVEERKMVPVIAGSSGDAERTEKVKGLAGAGVVDMTGKTSLGALYYLLSGSALFVGVDSGPAHIAAATGVPAVILFSGINDPEQWAPRGNNVKLVYPGKGKSLSKVQPEEVFRAIDGVL